MIRLEVKFHKGSFKRAVLAHLERREEELNARTPMFIETVLFPLMEDAMRQQFATHGAFFGTPWDGRKQAAPGQLGMRSGAMYRALTEGGPGSIRTVNGNYFAFGLDTSESSPVRYARWFHGGAPARKQEPRPLLPKHPHPFFTVEIPFHFTNWAKDVLRSF